MRAVCEYEARFSGNMSFRTRKDDDVSSDDEGPAVRRARLENEDEVSTSKKKAHVWTDVAIEQTLNDGSYGLDLAIGGRDIVNVSRGPESFLLPKDKDSIESKGESPVPPKGTLPIVTVSPAAEDPFGDTVDLADVEGFGVTKSANQRPAYMKRTNYFVKGKMYKSNEIPGRNGEPVRGNWNNRGMGGRGRGGYQTRQKRPWNNPAGLITKEYSLEALMAYEIPEGLTLDQLGEEIATALGDQNPDMLKQIVQEVGEEKALKLFEETRQVEAGGGMMINNGERRRTPGGVFIAMFKADLDVAPEIKDRLFEESKKQFRVIQSAKRRKGKNVSYEDKLKEASDLLTRERSTEDINEGEELPELPTVQEVLGNPANVDTMES